jgi:hypothetical protein
MYVWDIISRSQDKWHMILEDDVEFNDESIMHVNELWEELSTNPDVDAVINLNCHNPYQLFCRFLSESDLLSSNMIAGGASAYMIPPLRCETIIRNDARKGARLHRWLPGFELTWRCAKVFGSEVTVCEARL